MLRCCNSWPCNSSASGGLQKRSKSEADLLKRHFADRNTAFQWRKLMVCFIQLFSVSLRAFFCVYCNMAIYCNTLEGNMQYGDDPYCFTPNNYHSVIKYNAGQPSRYTITTKHNMHMALGVRTHPWDPFPLWAWWPGTSEGPFQL